MTDTGVTPPVQTQLTEGDAVLLAANRITHMDYPDDAEERLRRFSEDAELLAATVLAGCSTKTGGAE